MAWFTSDIEKKNKVVINKSVSIQQGTNTDVTLTTPFNNKTRTVMLCLSASGVYVDIKTIPIELFKMIGVSIGAVRLCYGYYTGDSQGYNIEVYYKNDSTIHVNGVIAGSTIDVIVISLEEDY